MTKNVIDVPVPPDLFLKSCEPGPIIRLSVGISNVTRSGKTTSNYIKLTGVS